MGGGWRQTAYLNDQLRVYGDFTVKTNFWGVEVERGGDVVFLRAKPVENHGHVYGHCTRHPLSFPREGTPAIVLRFGKLIRFGTRS